MLLNKFQNNLLDAADAPWQPTVLVLGTGGTIAGTASRADDLIGYTAGQIGIQSLVEASVMATTPDGTARRSFAVQSEQVAQIDSKDMSQVVWQALLQRVRNGLMQPQVTGIVITHGTDTLEETAYFLHCTLPMVLTQDLLHKPVVLTCAMRPATALDADGPQNLQDAIDVAGAPDSHGVLVVCAGHIHGPLHLQKVHTQRLDAFSSGEVGPLGRIAYSGAENQAPNGQIRPFDQVYWINKPLVPVNIEKLDTNSIAIGNQLLAQNQPCWPRVEIVMSHAGVNGAVVDALLACSTESLAAPLSGIVVAATGNGTVHHALEAALLRAQAAGVQVVRSTRCVDGAVTSPPGRLFEDAGTLSPTKARIALTLQLMGQGDAD